MLQPSELEEMADSAPSDNVGTVTLSAAVGFSLILVYGFNCIHTYLVEVSIEHNDTYSSVSVIHRTELTWEIWGFREVCLRARYEFLHPYLH